MNDLKFAFRQLLKNPDFTAVAVLALGIEANMAIFSLVSTTKKSSVRRGIGKHFVFLRLAEQSSDMIGVKSSIRHSLQHL